MTPRAPLLTVREAAALLAEAGMSVTEETIRRWVRTGRLAVVRSPGGILHFRPSDVEALLEPSTEAAAS